MRALVWHGHGDVRVDTVPDPVLESPSDAVVRVSSSGICGSDLHLLDGYVPTMEKGDILGHEAVGEVVAVGGAVTRLKKGDRVVVPFTISCGTCFFCKKSLFSLCDASNPGAAVAAKALGHAPAGVYGCSHMFGGYAGAQAEYLRVPFADVGPLKVESDLSDAKLLPLTDAFPTGYMAAENCGIEPGDVVAIWGCGPVGQLAIQSAWMLGAGRVIAIDRVPERLEMARKHGKAEIVDFGDNDKVYEQLQEMTRGRGPDRCIDAVGCEAHGTGGIDVVLDKAKAAVNLTTDRAHVLRQAIYCCRKGGTLSIPGAYIGMTDTIPMGAFMHKGLTMKSGRAHVQAYLRPLLRRVEAGEIDPSFIVTHTMPLSKAPEAYRRFRDKKDGCVKIALQP